MEARSELVAAVKRDLMGPHGGKGETLHGRPGDTYLTGILFPVQDEQAASETATEDDDDRDVADDSDGSPGVAISMANMRRPTSMGISFSLNSESPRPVIRIEGSAGRYERQSLESAAATQVGWVRLQVPLDTELTVSEGLHSVSVPDEGLRWWVKGVARKSRGLPATR